MPPEHGAATPDSAPVPETIAAAPSAGLTCGFSLIETCLVALIVGLVLWLGVYSIEHMLKQGRESRTKARLVQVKDCLIKRAAFNNRYPTYEPDGVDCDELSFDVNACLCQGGEPVLDAWGHELLYIEGLDSSSAGLAGRRILPLAANEPLTQVLPESRLIDENGMYMDDVAFVLVSNGKNGEPDHLSLPQAAPAPLNPDSPPDFSSRPSDELFLFVRASELRAAAAE